MATRRLKSDERNTGKMDCPHDKLCCESSNWSSMKELSGNYALIIGNGRSGTNWLLNILDASPQTHCRNEPHEITSSPFHALPQVSELLSEPNEMAERWDSFVKWSSERMGERDYRFTVQKEYIHKWAFRSGLAAISTRPRAKDFLRRLPSGYAGLEWTIPWWLGSQSMMEDAYAVLKINDFRAWHASWIFEQRPNVPIFHIIRHPAGYLNSAAQRFFNHLLRDEAKAECELYRNILRDALTFRPSWADKFGDIDKLSLFEAVMWFWSFNNTEICKLAERHPRYQRIVYEDLVSDPLGFATLVYNHLGLRMDSEILGHLNAQRTESVWGKLAGTPAEVATNWKKGLGRVELDLVETILNKSHLAELWK